MLPYLAVQDGGRSCASHMVQRLRPEAWTTNPVQQSQDISVLWLHQPDRRGWFSTPWLRISHEGGGVWSKWTPVDPTVITLKVHVCIYSHGVYLQFYSVSCNMSICKCNSTSFKTKLVGRSSSGFFSGSKQLQLLLDRRRSYPDLTRWGSRLDRV